MGRNHKLYYFNLKTAKAVVDNEKLMNLLLTDTHKRHMQEQFAITVLMSSLICV